MKLHHMMAIALLAAGLAACSAGEPAPQASAPPAPVTAATPSASVTPPLAPATYEGYGDMRFDMDESTFRKAWGGDLKGQSPAAGSTCTYLYPTWVKAPAEIGFMFEGGKFVRYDVTTTKETAPGGGMVGMEKARLLSLYAGKTQEQPDKYVPGASTLRVAGDDHGVLLFEIGTEGKVNKWRVGIPPQIDYVEGCG
ncbi:lectin [Dyella subtropica]|uniref:lectin n=1 Tax=Dyella subtropica TaxID=2992127 RepID=UPI00224D6CA3|nr:lectin [Dyella subtropica]